MATVYRIKHWSVRQHRDQVQGRAGGITRALTDDRTAVARLLGELVARDVAEYQECLDAGMTPDEADRELRRRNNARVAEEMGL